MLTVKSLNPDFQKRDTLLVILLSLTPEIVGFCPPNLDDLASQFPASDKGKLVSILDTSMIRMDDIYHHCSGNLLKIWTTLMKTTLN